MSSTLHPDVANRILQQLGYLETEEQKAEREKYDWTLKARVEQLPPPLPWWIWVILAGRGFGKTRSGAETAKGWSGYQQLPNLEQLPGSRGAIVAPTFADARDTCIEGDSGILSVLPERAVKTWNRSMGELHLTNGTRIKCFSAEEPERLRGPQHHWGWCFIADTAVATPFGDQPVQDFRPGDLITTRDGCGVVLGIGSRIASLVRVSHSEGPDLVGTPDHPVMTKRGWRELGRLSPGDRLIGAWKDDGDPTRLATSIATRVGRSCTGIEPYGKSTTVQSQRICRCITRTTSRVMTESRICFSCHQVTTEGIMQLRMLSPSSVQSVAGSTGVARRMRAAPVTVRYAGGRPESGVVDSKFENVSTAEEHSRRGLETSVVSAVSTLVPDGLVYNLSVGPRAEYFANGVLVHNCDEFGAWRYQQETWDQLMFGLRLGESPRVVVTTTPKPSKVLKSLLDRDDGTVHVTRGSTFDNAANLAAPALEELRARYEGTRLGRQELYAELLLDVPGALWTLGLIDETRVSLSPDMERVAVSVDPSGGAGPDHDEQGIVVAGRGVDGHGYTVADRSCSLSPNGWGRRAVQAYVDFSADVILVERNFGGDMAEATILSAARDMGVTVNVKSISVTRGKVLRAEPVSALYEQGRWHHIGSFPELEDQMVSWTPDSGTSPDRIDANVMGATELMLQPKKFGMTF